MYFMSQASNSNLRLWKPTLYCLLESGVTAVSSPPVPGLQLYSEAKGLLQDSWPFKCLSESGVIGITSPPVPGLQLYYEAVGPLQDSWPFNCLTESGVIGVSSPPVLGSNSTTRLWTSQKQLHFNCLPESGVIGVSFIPGLQLYCEPVEADPLTVYLKVA